MSAQGWFLSILDWGVSDETPPNVSRHLRFTDGVLLLFLGASVFESLACFAVGATRAGWTNLPAILLFSGCLGLMRLRKTYAARLLFITGGNVSAVLFAAQAGPDAGAQFVIMGTAVICLAMFPPEELLLGAYGIVACVADLVLLEITDYHPWGLARALYTAQQLQGLRIATVLMFCGVIYACFWMLIQTARRSQETLVASAKLVALGEMAAGIAHEVNNPMTRIVASAEKLDALAVRGQVAPAEAQAIARTIVDTSMRVAGIIQGLQAFSRDSVHDDLDRVSLAALIESTLSYCRARLHTHNVELRVRNGAAEEWVLARESQLAQILLNLLNNALDAVEQLKERWIEISLEPRGPYLELAVTDSGNGIPPAIRNRMFEPFFTTKPVGKGTGLGLSISRGIANAHGGRLSYDESSERTRFVVRLPRLAAPTV